MAETDPARRQRRPVDEAALAHQIRRLRRAPGAPWLHGEAARRMAERLSVIRAQPALVLDWWSRTGGSAEVLARAYPKARVLAVEPEAPARSPSWWARWRGAAAVAEDAVEPGQAQLVWANMMLHAVADPEGVMARWQRALAVDGFLMFSTFGPGTLETLSELYERAGWPPPLAPLVDMHDLGDMLVHAGFADPVMDQETVTLTWPDAASLLAELRGLGGNVAPGRHPGLRTPRWRERLISALSGIAAADGRPALRFELVYGHAFKPPPRARVEGETRVPVEDLRAMARRGSQRR